MPPFRFILFVAIAASLVSRVSAESFEESEIEPTVQNKISVAAVGEVGQANDTASTKTDVRVGNIGPVEAIREAEVRLGAIDRMFLIEDQWEFDRCALLLPKLPKVDLTAESLLIVVSWKYTARTLKSVESEDDTLVIKVDQAKPPGAIADSYHPPKFLVFKIPAWHGPVRFEVNHGSSFAIPRGEALVRQSEDVWEEILRIHSGGRPKGEQIVRYYKLRSPDTSRTRN